MPQDNQASNQELQKLERAQNSSFFGKLAIYGSMSGPGWIQSAVTLGGGSLVGALFLGVIGGTSLLWVQPLAMIFGVILLSSIAYVTLSTGERPFLTVGRYVSPSLAWMWLVATILADVIFCAAQVALALGVLTLVIFPEWGESKNILLSLAITGGLAALAWFVAMGYQRGGAGAKAVETGLKFLVAIVVICFFISTGVVISNAQDFSWGNMFAGFIPDFGSLFRLSPELEAAVAATGESANYWREKALNLQRNQAIAAFGSAVGINMTWLLPYTLIKRGWGRKHREFARFDLSIGLLIPFVLASAALALLAAVLFHAQPEDALDENGQVKDTASAGIVKQIDASMLGYLKAEQGEEELVTAIQAERKQEDFKALSEPVQAAYTTAIANIPAANGGEAANRQVAAMLTKRGVTELVSTLKPLFGKENDAARWIFGIGVLAMAFSTMIVHMMMNGYAVGEAANRHGKGTVFAIGAAMPAICAALSPLFWGDPAVKTSLVISAATLATTLLPIAYLAFLLLMNSKRGLGEDAPRGKRLLIWNCLLWPAFLAASFACVWKLLGFHSQDGKQIYSYVGLSLMGLLLVVAILDFIRNQRKTGKARPSLLS